MVREKRVFPTAALVLLVAILSGLIVSPALGQQPERVKVLVGFTRQPGAAEEALVRGVGGTTRYTYHLVPAIAATVPERAIDGLRRNPNVTSIDLDGQVWAIDAELNNAWGVKRIGAGSVHDSGNKGQGVKVAIIDSGIDYNHPDLDANYAGGYDFVNNDDDPMDDYGHGTHVAGTVAAEDDDAGVVGVAPEAELYALKVLNASGSGYWSDFIAAVQWCVDKGVQVANLSLGSSRDPGGTVQAAFDSAEAAGVTIVAAAGNSGNLPGKGNNVIYPAKYDSVIAVAATDSSDERAIFSSTGDQVELAAPGVTVYSTWPVGMTSSPHNPQPVCDDSEVCYKYGSGTSMASPHVAGTAALVIATGVADANGNGRINDEVRLRLDGTADDLGQLGRDPQYGFGLVDADEAAPLTDTTPPAKVAGLTVATASCAELGLGWGANAETDLHHYNVYRSTSSGGSYDLIASSTTNSYSDSGLTALTTYYYVVSAVDNSGNEGQASGEASGTTSADDLGPVTSNVVADPNPTHGATSVTLTAKVSDSTTGNSSIVYAEYFTDAVGDDGSGTTMSASDGAFGSPAEGVTASIDVSGWAAGQYTLYVHGKDAWDKWGATESVVLNVAEAPSTVMYVDSIVFSSKVAGPNKFLYTTVKVVDGGGSPLGGVGVEVTLAWDKEGNGGIDDSWNFAGDTGTDGTAKFTLLKAPAGDYTATVTNLFLADYTWDTTKGVTSASCQLKDDGAVIQ